jgi:hypothetical protein
MRLPVVLLAAIAALVLAAGLPVGCAIGAQDPACGGGICPAGKVATCTDQCVTPVEIGQPCDPMPCSDTSVCVAGSCVPANGGNVCALPPVGKEILGPCDPQAPGNDHCPADTFCKDYSACNPTDAVMKGGHCSAAATQGAPCDVDWFTPSTTVAAKCAPCAIGHHCEKNDPSDALGVCTKDCATAADDRDRREDVAADAP